MDGLQHRLDVPGAPEERGFPRPAPLLGFFVSVSRRRVYGAAVHHPSGYIGNDLLQEICTPIEILEPLYAHCEGPFDLDPFGNRNSIVRARHVNYKSRRCGFEITWWRKVFGNPPFARLGECLKKASETVLELDSEIFILCPVRSHRVYWSNFWRAQAVCFLKAFCFLGWEETYPFPCVLVYYGPRPERFMRFVAHLGVTMLLTPWHLRHSMGPMSISEEYELRQREAIIQVVRAHPEKSLDQLVAELSLSKEDSALLRSIPLQDLTGTADPPDSIVVGRPANGDPRTKSSAAKNGKKTPKKPKKKPPKRVVTAKTKTSKPNGVNGVNGTGKRAAARAATKKALDEFLAKYKKGSALKTADAMDALGFGRPKTLRCLAERENLVKVGTGRAAHFEVR